jgi:hypothetical protein
MKKIYMEILWEKYIEYTFINSGIKLDDKQHKLLKILFFDGAETILNYIQAPSVNIDIIHENLARLSGEVIQFNLINSYDEKIDWNLNKLEQLQNEWKIYYEKEFKDAETEMPGFEKSKLYFTMKHAYCMGLFTTLYIIVKLIDKEDEDKDSFINEIFCMKNQVTDIQRKFLSKESDQNGKN